MVVGSYWNMDGIIEPMGCSVRNDQREGLAVRLDNMDPLFGPVDHLLPDYAHALSLFRFFIFC